MKHPYLVAAGVALVILWAKQSASQAVPSGPGASGAGTIFPTVQQPAPGNISPTVTVDAIPANKPVRTSLPVLVTSRPSFMAQPNNPMTARLNSKQDLYY